MIYKFCPRDDDDETTDALLTEAQLERLADFYHEHGFYQEAIATLEELISLKEAKIAVLQQHRRAS